MRVRKKQSKRTSTRMKEGIQKKATAKHRKERRAAKTDVTWKSRHSKDPGIPSSFPYKNRILEAIEVKKHQDSEEMEKKRLERIEKRKKHALSNNDDEDMVSDDEEQEQEGGLAALMESAQQAAKEYEHGKSASSSATSVAEDLEVEDFDIDFADDEEVSYAGGDLEKSRKAFDKIFKTVVDNSDVVLYVLDARDPEGTRSRKVEEAILQTNGEKKLVLVLNKVDLIPPHVLEQWLTFLKSSYPTIPFRANASAITSTSYNKKLTTTNTSNGLLESLKKYANNKNFKRSIVVGVIGYPNVGKSSIINALTSSRRGSSSNVCPVGNQAGVTTSLREIKIDGKLKIMDSPGIVFPSEFKSKNKVDKDAELALLSALPSKYIVDAFPAVLKLVKRVSKNDEMTESFKKLYDLPPIPANDPETFTKHFLIHVARKRGRIGRKGIPDISGAGLSVLNDWRDGKILGWVLPKSSKQSSLDIIEQQQQKKQQQESVEQTSVVSEFSAEFDLDSLFASLDSAIEEQK